VKIVEHALKYHGWKNLNEVKNSPELWEQHKNKVFAVWDGDTKDADKQFIKSVSNNSDNIFGNKIRVIIGSPSIREGVTVKHAQHIHILDPLWNMSAKVQVEGRAIRFCSHSDIDEKRDKPLKRHVNIHIYNLVPMPGGMVAETADQIIAKIVKAKQQKIEIGENALKKVAIDFHLFKKMYSQKEYGTSPHNPGSADSNLSFDQDDNVKNKKNKDNKNTCPSKRRPDPEGNCPQDHYVKDNLQGHPCCYKYTKKEREERKRNKPSSPKTPPLSPRKTPPRKTPRARKSPAKPAITTKMLYTLMERIQKLISSKLIKLTMEKSKYYFDKPENQSDVEEMYNRLLRFTLANIDKEAAEKLVKKTFLDYIKKKESSLIKH
jgi:hypothetical protein